jgi:hypothetical protein
MRTVLDVLGRRYGRRSGRRICGIAVSRDPVCRIPPLCWKELPYAKSPDPTQSWASRAPGGRKKYPPPVGTT